MNVPQHIITEEIDSQEIELFTNDAEGEFKKWLKLQNRIQLNVAKVCEKYRDKLYKLEIPTFPLMFDRNTNLFFCRNAKVKQFIFIYALSFDQKKEIMQILAYLAFLSSKGD